MYKRKKAQPLFRQTMVNWMITGSERWLKPVYEQMKRELLAQEVLHADETRLQVLQEPGKAAQSESYDPACLVSVQRTVR